MSAATLTPQTGRVTGPGVSFPRTLNSEWIKFTTLRSTWVLLATTVLVMVGIGLLGGWGIASGMEQMEAAGQDPAAAGMDSSLLYLMTSGGLDFGQLIIGSLGVLLIASEYSTGMIRSTMTAVPSRLSPLFAKALVVARGGRRRRDSLQLHHLLPAAADPGQLRQGIRAGRGEPDPVHAALRGVPGAWWP